jgi:hypothetical protein
MRIGFRIDEARIGSVLGLEFGGFLFWINWMQLMEGFVRNWLWMIEQQRIEPNLGVCRVI